MRNFAEKNGPEIVAGVEVTQDIASLGLVEEAPTQELWKKALKFGAIAAGAALAIYLANRTGVVNTEGVNP